jgi:NAD+ synthase (glutamine-hydrolysing)
VRIAVAQLNLTVGDVAGNTARIVAAIAAARDTHRARLVVFPELAVTGYPPEDLLLRPALHDQVRAALQRIADSSRGIAALVGFPETDGDRIYNCCAWYDDGARLCTYRKRVLPNYGVFDERRWFVPGDAVQTVDLDGIPAAPGICEDLWTPEHAADCARRGARLLITINASPYDAAKPDERWLLLEQRCRETGLAILYVNLVGGQDELVFDGGSLAISPSAGVAQIAPQFDEGLHLVEAEPADGSLRLLSATPHPPLPRLDGIYRALVLGIRDYVRKNRFPGVVLGLSGGIDSALTLCLAVDALGADRVETLIMPSRYTAPMSIEDATLMAQRLAVKHDVVSIEPPFAAFNEALAPLFRGRAPDLTEENIQARCRGVLLMAVSNKTGRMVLTTGNKSELSVGYATLYGDMAGGFAPLKDVPKTLVCELAEFRNRDGAPIPRRVIDRPPSAELRPDQKDEDSLPPYAVLDPILERYIEQDQPPETIVQAGFDRDTVRRVVALVDRSEYKRRQSAPGVKITRRAFGRDRRYPITSAYSED